MNKVSAIIASALVSMLWTAPVIGQEKPAGELLFEHYDWDFGQIKEEDGIVTHVFRYTNVTNNPVQIVSVSTSCGCTNAQFSMQPLAPGEIGELTVHFSPARTEGRVFREVEVFTKNRDSFARLTVSADVIPMPMGLEQINPHILSADVRSNVNRCNFGYIAQGKTVSKAISIVNIGKKDSKIQILTTGSKYGMSVSGPDILGPEESSVITITYTIPKGKKNYGMTRDTIWIKADGQPSAEPVAISALRVDDFEGTENKPQPAMRVEPAYVDFGSKAPGKVFKQTITIGNTGKADLIFRNVETVGTATAEISEGTVIKPGQEKKVTVSIKNSATPSTATTGSIYLTTNDPTRAFRELRLQIDTK